MSGSRKILVANRGAIARRILRTANDQGMQSVAVYSEADANAPYLQEASETVALAGVSAKDTYLNGQQILNAARQTGADALHPGYGFLAENAEFAEQVQAAGLRWVGPDPRWLSALGDKVQGRSLLAEHGFPVFPGSQIVQDDYLAAAEEIGFPLMVKPAGGGGGLGMQAVYEAHALENAVKRSRAVSASAFGVDGVFLEKLIERPRHIEYQILADNHGNVAHAFERECSIQRRNQKLIEETPAPGIEAGEILHLAERAVQACAGMGYNNLGTLETLRDAQGESGFLEMNTRIQVEHAVTEAVTGLDLIALQISLADGGNLPDDIQRNGFAVEARIYAEDPVSMLPSTGRLSVFDVPEMYGVRVETGYAAGLAVTPYYDAMLAKVIAHAHTRELAIGRLVTALKAFQIRGVATNQPLLLKVLQHERFIAGEVHTGFLQQYVSA